jgi:integrase
VAKKASGNLIWNGKQWSARVPIVVDGERVRRCYPLGTDSKPAARVKLRRLLAEIAGGRLPTIDEAAAGETFEQAARRIVEAQRGEGLGTWSERLARLERYAFGELGALLPDKIRPGHVLEALEAARETGLAKQSGAHLRIDLSTVFRRLVIEGTVPSNPVAAVPLPQGFKVEKRPRVMLTDDEFGRFVSSPNVPEDIRLMALVSRLVGGMRTSDLHAWDWRHVDTENWQSTEVYRPKTDDEGDDVTQLTQIELPEDARAPLRAWWTRWQRPSEGPVFPIMNGKRAGERQGKRSHVRELRRHLWDAGVRRPLDGYDAAVERLRAADSKIRKLTEAQAPGLREVGRERLAAEVEAKRCCAIQTDTTRTRSVDFHSFRRAYATGLAAHGVNLATAMALTGHKDPRTHVRYVKLAQSAVRLRAPAESLPRLPAQSAVIPIRQNVLAVPADQTLPDDHEPAAISL